MTAKRDFYVGYQKQAPAAVARFLRRAVVLLALLAMVVAALLAAVQNTFDPGVFEFGIVRSFEGVVREQPYPVLLVERPGSTTGTRTSRFLLVAFGKRGAGAAVAGLDGRRVRLEGSLIHREGETMIELAGGGVEPLDEPPTTLLAGRTRLGTHTLRGEIVDSKCFLGVMKPGRGKPHRACAARCISGGIPPVLRVETSSGDYRHFLLVDEEGASVNSRVLDVVAEPIEITGEVFRDGDLLILAADPADYRGI